VNAYENVRTRKDEKLANFWYFFVFFVLRRKAVEGESEARVGIEPA
jgi:hypothetical protein